jgi:hypothetical protein
MDPTKFASISELPFWIRLGPRSARAAGPFYPQEQTSSGYTLRSVQCPQAEVANRIRHLVGAPHLFHL